MSFYHWLVLYKAKKGGPTGELAHIAREDINFPRKEESKDILDEYVKSLELQPEILDAYENVFKQYLEYKKRKALGDMK